MNGSPGTRGGRRAAFVAGVSLTSVAAACGFFFAGFRGIRYDSAHYWILSRIVSTEGLANLCSRVRTYGYPLFLSIVTGGAEVSTQTARALVFAAQLLIHLAVALVAARSAERAFGSPRFFYGTFLLMAWNPFALIHTTELLTDSLSASLLTLSLFSSLAPVAPGRRAFGAFLWAGLAVAVRPANLAVLPALGIAWIIRARLYRELLRRAILPAALAVALALSPQLVSNGRWYGRWTPVTVDALYADQTVWGMAILKYGTLIVPGQPPQLVYRNPFYPPGVSRPAEFLRRSPRGYLKTLGLHAFALFDQDLPFTYVQNLRPAYRWPLSLLNYAYLYLCLVGLAVGLGRARSASPSVRLYFWSAAVVCAAYVALYIPVAVEARFSLPVYLLLAPACVFAIAWLSHRRSGTIVAMTIAGAGFLAACVQISLWLTRQAPALASVLGP